MWHRKKALVGQRSWQNGHLYKSIIIMMMNGALLHGKAGFPNQ